MFSRFWSNSGGLAKPHWTGCHETPHRAPFAPRRNACLGFNWICRKRWICPIIRRSCLLAVRCARFGVSSHRERSDTMSVDYSVHHHTALVWFLRTSNVFQPSCCIIRVGLPLLLDERPDWLSGVLQSFITDRAARLSTASIWLMFNK